MSVAPSSARPVPGKSRMRSGTRRAAHPSPASGESACPLAAASPTPCLSPALEGVVSVMSPQIALRQVGSRGSSADGFRRGPDPDPRPIPSRPGRPASTSPNPRARTPGRRSRGLPGDLAGRVTISRVTRRSRGPDGVPLADPDSPDGEDDDEAMARTDSGPARTEFEPVGDRVGEVDRLRASADRMADQPDGEDGEAPTPGAWRRPSGRAWAEGRRRSPSRCAQSYWCTAPPFTGA